MHVKRHHPESNSAMNKDVFWNPKYGCCRFALFHSLHRRPTRMAAAQSEDWQKPSFHFIRGSLWVSVWDKLQCWGSASWPFLQPNSRGQFHRSTSCNILFQKNDFSYQDHSVVLSATGHEVSQQPEPSCDGVQLAAWHLLLSALVFPSETKWMNNLFNSSE